MRVEAYVMNCCTAIITNLLRAQPDRFKTGRVRCAKMKNEKLPISNEQSLGKTDWLLVIGNFSFVIELPSPRKNKK
ncbi:MAG: hypothetical protein R2854_16715 [Caldilineaceae bacterium]